MRVPRTLRWTAFAIGLVRCSPASHGTPDDAVDSTSNDVLHAPDGSDRAMETATDAALEASDDVIDALDLVAPDTHDASDLDADATCSPQPFMYGYYACFNDPNADAAVFCPYAVCTPDQCPSGCFACPTSPQGAGMTCVTDLTSDAQVACPNGIVCTADQCPAGCALCATAFDCIPAPSMDGGAITCVPSMACDPSGCPPGCIAAV